MSRLLKLAVIVLSIVAVVNGLQTPNRADLLRRPEDLVPPGNRRLPATDIPDLSFMIKSGASGIISSVFVFLCVMMIM